MCLNPQAIHKKSCFLPQHDGVMFPFSMGSLRAPGRPSRGNTLGCLTERSSKPIALHAPHRTPQLRDLDILLAESRGCARDLGISGSRGSEGARVVGSHSCSAHCLRLGSGSRQESKKWGQHPWRVGGLQVGFSPRGDPRESPQFFICGVGLRG